MAFPFRHNETVEISRKHEGFFGSHYPAKHSTPATLGLCRPEIPVSKFAVGDRVDACENGGWWVGRISREVDPNYYVQLDSKGKEVHCAFYRVRIHLDWVDGKWVYPGNGPKRDDGEAKEGEHKFSRSFVSPP
ncbi:hypothetical protein F0562_013894 [Nyssa sinensis]|uniref:Agenet domain-containing protein n=1 Tax=Nyssa sinensis TaxID=561372 RepID=A0A5J4ZRF7_9ASTE|nr:hypothetical protein F0562_013894 [Nyssa sinensis]